MFRVYRLLNLLSLDVAVGAILTALFFSKLLQAPSRLYSVIALGLTVWVIYTADRLMDVQQLKKPAISERHRFHQKRFKILSIIVCITILVVCILAVFVRPAVLVGGLILAPLSVLYLLLQKKLPIKELAVAIVYTVGVLLPAWPGSWNLFIPVAGLVVQLFLIALTNLLLFAWFELEPDIKMGQASFATRVGKKRLTLVLQILFISGITFSLGYSIFSNPLGIIFLLMWLGLITLLIYPRYFEQLERYRLWGDAIFYLPAIGLIV
jgi:hypothetical protein